MRASVIVTIALALLLLGTAPARAQTEVSACGTLVAFEAPTTQRPTGEVQINQAARLVSYRVSGSGTVTPPDIAAIGTALNPVTVQFRGTAGADGTVTAFSLTRVASCGVATLPTTSTGAATTAAASLALALAIALLAALAVIARARRISRP